MFKVYQCKRVRIALFLISAVKLSSTAILCHDTFSFLYYTININTNSSQPTIVASSASCVGGLPSQIGGIIQPRKHRSHR